MMARLINFIVRTIENNIDFSDFFSIIIIGIGIWSFFKCHIEAFKISKGLNNFNDHKDELIGSNAEKINYIENNKLFLDNKYLESLWSDYNRYVRNNTVDEKIPDIGRYFNRNRIIEVPSRRQIAQLIPGIMTALGILGTFLGLQDGISQLDMSNPEIIESSIGNLTDGMSLAFITSIVGIVGSLIWSYLDKKQYRYYMNTLERFKDTFYETFEVFSIEYFMDKVLKSGEESTTAIKHIASDISLELTKAITNSVNDDILPSINSSMDNIVKDSLLPTLSFMSNSFEEFTDSASSSQSMALDMIISDFKNEMDSLVNEEFKELKLTLGELTGWHKGVKVELSDLINEIKESALNYQELNISSETVLERYSGLFGELNNINLDIETRIKSISEIMYELNNIVVFNAETVNEIGGINKEAAEIHKTIEGGLLTLSDNIKTTEENLELISMTLDQSTLNFSENLKSGLNTTFEIFDENLSEISKRLSGTIIEMNESVEEMPELITALYNEIQGHTMKLSEAVEFTTELYGEMKDIYNLEKNEAI